MPEANDVSTDSSPLGEAIASSPEVQEEVKQQVQETQTPTAEQGDTQEQVEEESRIPYSRFKEKVDEANWLKQQLESQLQNRQTIQQPTQPTQSPYANMTPEEERFWRAVDERAERIADSKIGKISPMLDAGAKELANIRVQQFRNAHPDIKPNSPDEAEIAMRIRQGYTPDDAYWAVTGPRGIRVAEEKVKQQVKQQTTAKRQANVEVNSIPSQAQPQRKLKFREEFERNLKLAEEGKL